MTKFSNFDTDFYGMKQFKKIMESQGIVDEAELRAFLIDSVEDFANDLDGKDVDYIDFNNGLAVVLNYEAGFEADDPELLVDAEGNALCVSIRETGSATMVSEWKVVAEPIAITQSDVEEQFEELAGAMYAKMLSADPEEVDGDFQYRDETIFDSLEDMAGAYNEWKDSINDESVVHVEDVSLDSVEINGIHDAIIFTLEDEITDADHDSLDEFFTEKMPQSITDWIEENSYSFDYKVIGRNEFAFVVW